MDLTGQARSVDGAADGTADGWGEDAPQRVSMDTSAHSLSPEQQRRSSTYTSMRPLSAFQPLQPLSTEEALEPSAANGVRREPSSTPQLTFKSADLRNALALQDALQYKLYMEGYLLVRHVLAVDGQPAHRTETSQGWCECFVQLCGTTLSIWELDKLNAAAAEGREVPPSFVNITDAFVDFIGLHVEASFRDPGMRRQLYHVFALNTAGNNRMLFCFNAPPPCEPGQVEVLLSPQYQRHPDHRPVVDWVNQGHRVLQAWINAIRLASWEKSRLEEIYTGALIRARLSAVRSMQGPGAAPENQELLVRSPLVKGRHEGWVRARFMGYTEWRRCWMVLQTHHHQGEEEIVSSFKRLFRLSPLPGAGGDRLPAHSPTSPVPDVNEPPPPPAGGAPSDAVAYFYESKKARKPFASLWHVRHVFAVYPSRPELVEGSSLFKVEGCLPQSTVVSATHRPRKTGWAMFMPDVKLQSNRGSNAEMMKWVIAFMDAFRLYGRPDHFDWDARSPDSPFFAHPIGPYKNRLFLDRVLAEYLDITVEDHIATRHQLHEVMAARMRGENTPILPALPPQKAHSAQPGQPMSQVQPAGAAGMAASAQPEQAAPATQPEQAAGTQPEQAAAAQPQPEQAAAAQPQQVQTRDAPELQTGAEAQPATWPDAQQQGWTDAQGWDYAQQGWDQKQGAWADAQQGQWSEQQLQAWTQQEGAWDTAPESAAGARSASEGAAPADAGTVRTSLDQPTKVSAAPPQVALPAALSETGLGGAADKTFQDTSSAPAANGPQAGAAAAAPSTAAAPPPSVAPAPAPGTGAASAAQAPSAALPPEPAAPATGRAAPPPELQREQLARPTYYQYSDEMSPVTDWTSSSGRTPHSAVRAPVQERAAAPPAVPAEPAPAAAAAAQPAPAVASPTDETVGSPSTLAPSLRRLSQPAFLAPELSTSQAQPAEAAKSSWEQKRASRELPRIDTGSRLKSRPLAISDYESAQILSEYLGDGESSARPQSAAASSLESPAVNSSAHPGSQASVPAPVSANASDLAESVRPATSARDAAERKEAQPGALKGILRNAQAAPAGAAPAAAAPAPAASTVAAPSAAAPARQAAAPAAATAAPWGRTAAPALSGASQGRAQPRLEPLQTAPILSDRAPNHAAVAKPAVRGADVGNTAKPAVLASAAPAVSTPPSAPAPAEATKPAEAPAAGPAPPQDAATSKETPPQDAAPEAPSGGAQRASVSPIGAPQNFPSSFANRRTAERKGAGEAAPALRTRPGRPQGVRTGDSQGWADASSDEEAESSAMRKTVSLVPPVVTTDTEPSSTPEPEPAARQGTPTAAAAVRRPPYHGMRASHSASSLDTVRNTFVKLNRDEMPGASSQYVPQGLLGAAHDGNARSARTQEMGARETGEHLVSVPSKPPPPQAGLMGAIRANERGRQGERTQSRPGSNLANAPQRASMMPPGSPQQAQMLMNMYYWQQQQMMMMMGMMQPPAASHQAQQPPYPSQDNMYAQQQAMQAAQQAYMNYMTQAMSHSNGDTPSHTPGRTSRSAESSQETTPMMPPFGMPPGMPGGMPPYMMPPMMMPSPPMDMSMFYGNASATPEMQQHMRNGSPNVHGTPTRGARESTRAAR